MKKFAAIILLACSIFLATIYCNADTITPEGITVIYQEDSVLTDAQKDQFEALILSDQTEYTPYSLLCLFGHDEVKEYAHVIKHKVFSVEPRCADQYYKVITCTRCDYMDATLASQAIIYCCPED